MKEQQHKRPVATGAPVRYWWYGLFFLALLGATGAVVYQYLSTIGTVQLLVQEQSETMAELLETEVANVAQYGPYRQERLERMFQNLVDTGAVTRIRLLDASGRTRVETPRDGGAAEAGPASPAEGHVIRREFVVREPFAAAHGAMAMPSVGGPGGGGNPSGLITGPVTLVLEFSDTRPAEVRRETLIHLCVSLLLVIAITISALLLLRAARRSAVAQRQLELAKQRTEHLEGINVMTAGLAHEIKNPIGAVHGFAQLLSERFDETTEEGRYSQVMLEALDGTIERINRLLSFARPKEPARATEDLDALVRKVVRLISPDMAQKEVDLVTELSAAEPAAFVDASQVQEVVLNLLLNSLDAVKPGGEIKVATDYDARTAGHRLVVLDDGEGINVADQDRVFRPYFTTKSKGSGLGLAICRKIVEDHGGSIELESSPGSGTGGTKITVTFPGAPEIS